MTLELIAKFCKKKIPHKANDNISEHITEEDIQRIQDEVCFHAKEMLQALMIDTAHDANTRETAKRIAKMYVREVFKGRYLPMPDLTSFPNDKKLDTLFTVGPIAVRSTCSHHLVPIIGKVWIGVVPGEELLGLSKFARLTDWVMSRPHIQEEAVCILADILEEAIKPKGLIVIMRAEHMCMSWRGVKETNAVMTSSVVRGCLEEDTAKKEFFSLIGGVQ